MKRSTTALFVATLIACLAFSAFAQDLSSPAKGTIIAPPSTAIGVPGKIHTPLYVFLPDNHVGLALPNGETPASVACIYGVTAPTNGCPKSGNVLPTGGSKAIAVIEYGQYSAVQSDFNAFNTQFGLPAQTLIQICTPTPPCPSNSGTGWDLETALDVQYAHAMAPHAQIIVVSFTNDPLTDGAETQAAQYIINNYGAGEVSNSWTYNGGEDPGELQLDSYFQQQGIVYFGSAGDNGLGPAYPSISPYVTSAGGTRITRDSNGNFTGESCWSGSGGGISQYEPEPQYQIILNNKLHGKRGTPDWAAIADPSTGVDVYSSTYCRGWCVVGGTSVASPVMAAITNQAGHFLPSTFRESSLIYGYYLNPGRWRTYFFDVVTGNNGSPAGLGWDECTGLGTIRKPSGL